MAETIALQTDQPISQPCKLHPQSMCPAFGSLRVLTRIEGSHPVMATDTGCLYGLTFVTHFYGARKSILAPTLGTAELMSGQIVEGTRAAIEAAAREPGCRLIPVISLCVAETAGMPEELLPRQAGEAEVVLVRVPAYAIHSHPEAKDVAMAALLRRLGDQDGPKEPRTVVLLGEVFPADPLVIDGVLRRMGVEQTITLPGRSIDDLRRAGRAGALAPLHPFYKETTQVFRSWNVPVVGGAPVGISGSYAWIKTIGAMLDLDPALVQQAAEEERERAQAMVAARPLSGRVFVTGYEGTELAYARLLVEAGAEVPYVSTSIAPDPLVLPDELWLKARGTKEVVYRKALEEDMSALDRYAPDLVLGTTPFSSAAKDRGIPGLYFTNQLASRPFFLSTGMAATLGLIRDTLDRSAKYREMQEFFAE
ncbi:MAG TPA: chlorophyllide a reductase subunit Y [Kouleothrix sp.]|uniref:chlorophyllide a reductase subunit Y n=1 Tax=Kouleothrix sp. TaxID=2779161 RepID=UPI002B9155B4|nr:chlorophyllide a reductase subunit Y [Kouleothrix sp.]HRC76063.1 chlorophyllide a reductase subunit Y [Kouleothrix sp.]